MARKLEAGFDGRYLMSSVLMTSTMKSDPATPPMRGSSFGVPVSAAATCIEGGSADGRGADGASGDVVDVAPSATGAVTAVAAPATATPARNLRRLTSGRGSLRFMEFSLQICQVRLAKCGLSSTACHVRRPRMGPVREHDRKPAG